MKSKDTYSSAIAEAEQYTSWMLEPFLPHCHGDILEVGIGHGSYYQQLAGLGRYVGVDRDKAAVDEATSKYGAVFEVEDVLSEDFAKRFENKFDCVLCINVLEHIEHDRSAVENFARVLKSGGKLLITVPAFNVLYNDLDRLAGHYRRYDRASLGALFESNEFVIDKLAYFNPIGGVGWWLNGIKRHKSLDSPAVNSQIRFFVTFVLPISRLIDPITRKFFGQSLNCIATVTK